MSADEKMELLLSAYRDGELTQLERARVEAAIARDPKLAARLADHDALGGALRAQLESVADEIDFTGLADRILEKAPTRRVPLGEGLFVRFSELFAFRRLQLVGGLAVVAAVIVSVPLLVGQLRDAPALPSKAPAAMATNEAPQPPAPTVVAENRAPTPTKTAPARVISVTTPDGTASLLSRTRAGAALIYVRSAP